MCQTKISSWREPNPRISLTRKKDLSVFLLCYEILSSWREPNPKILTFAKSKFLHLEKPSFSSSKEFAIVPTYIPSSNIHLQLPHLQMTKSPSSPPSVKSLTIRTTLSQVHQENGLPQNITLPFS